MSDLTKEQIEDRKKLQEFDVDNIDWESIWKDLGKDLLDIVMDFKMGRADSSETLELISKFGMLSYLLGRNDVLGADDNKMEE